MTKELERVGLPTALICTILPLALTVGPNRIVAAKAIPHPLGDPTLTRDEEKEFRKRIVIRSLETLTTEVTDQLVLQRE